ncbi:arginine decarboxylase, partial [Planococcus sp. SIMBA_143]
ISHERVQTILSMLTTTSTSYLLLASLDTARKQLATIGHSQIDRAIGMANRARKSINELQYIHCTGKEILGTEAAYSYDP